MSPTVHGPGTVRPRDRVIMIRDHIHVMIRAEVSTSLQQRAGRGLYSKLAYRPGQIPEPEIATVSYGKAPVGTF